MNNYSKLLLFSVLVTSCSLFVSKSIGHKVNNYGALYKMMHEGDLSAKVNLNDFENKKYLYAVGAFENLNGEIQIFGGVNYNTKVIDNQIVFDESYDKKAALFVYAEVRKWQSINIPDSILTHVQLEIFVAKSAQLNNINTKEPFPFLIDGTPKSFDWHIIDWKDGDNEHSHEKHVNSGLHGTKENTEVELLGFYSDAHHTIFTHHTTNMHIHVRTLDKELAGHLDGIVMGKGMVLKLPK